MANKEMKTIQFPNSDTVYEIVDNAAREALAGKQPSGDYATTKSLNSHTGNTNNPHGVTKTQVGLENVANERQYSSQNPPPYPVSSVAGKTGIVTLNKSDVQLGNVDNTADMDKPVSTAQATAINAKYTKPVSGVPKTDLAADVQTSLEKADSAYQKPSTGIPKADLSEEVQNALETAAQGAPDATTTVKGIMTLGADGGAARYGEKSDVGLENVDNVKQYSASNPPPYPVTSVAGRTGAVTLVKTDVGLSNVDNTSDTNKPVSTAQAAAIAEAKQAGTNAQNAIDTHAAKINNPHNVTAEQVGAYVKPAEGIPETDLSAEVQDKLNSTGAAENLLQSSVTANRQANVTEGDMINLGYALGLEEGKEYTVKYKFNGSDIVATAKYEAPSGLPLEGGELCLCQSISAEGMTMTFPLLLGVSPYNASVEDYQTAAMNYGYLVVVDKHQITGDNTYTADENNSSVYVRALQTANAQNAVSVEITAIEPFAEVVADKVKNALTIGDVVFDGSSAKSVDLSEYAKTTGTYSDMTVGNAEKLNGKAASEYALMTIKTTTEWKSQNPVLGAGVFGFDSTSKIIKIGDGTTAWNALPAFATPHFTFATAEWGDISRIAAAGDARKYFNVGDEKTIALSTGEAVTLVILGFNHDDLTSGGKAPITIGMKNLLATQYRMNSSNTNAGGWNNSRFRTSTMQLLLSEFPSDLRAVIKSVDKKATSGSASTTITTSSDKLFLFSEVEIDGTTESGYASEGEQYEYWKTIKDGKTSADRIKYSSNGNGSAMTWWLRSPDVTNATDFCYIGSNGTVGFTDAVGTWGTCFGFCI